MATVTRTRTTAPAPTPAAPTCRLTLTIARRSYAVRRLRPDARDFGVTRAYRLRRIDGGGVYTVARTLDGFTCDCADATFRHPEGNAQCKHVRACVAWGLLD